MTKNIGTTDRLIRLIIGSFLLVLSLVSQSPILAIIGIFTLYEAVSSWCIFYQLIGRDTCPLPNSSTSRRISLKSYYLSGLGILVTAILLNIFASYLGWSTWYTVFSNPDNLSQISLDNWLFLLIIYPLSLGIVGSWIYNLTHGRAL